MVSIFVDGSAQIMERTTIGTGGIIHRPGEPLQFLTETRQRFKHDLKPLSTRAEIRACMNALEHLHPEEEAVIYTDLLDIVFSQYQLERWKRDGWINDYGKLFECPELFEALYAKARNYRVTFVHRRADHSLNSLSGIAHHLASGYIRRDGARINPAKTLQIYCITFFAGTAVKYDISTLKGGKVKRGSIACESQIEGDLRACIQAIDYYHQKQGPKILYTSNLNIIQDLVNVPTWLDRGACNKHGRAVQNFRLWYRLYKKCCRHSAGIQHIRDMIPAVTDTPEFKGARSCGSPIIALKI